MRSRIIVAALLLPSATVSFAANELPRVQLVNWPAPALWAPTGGQSRDASSTMRGQVHRESALAATGFPFPFLAVAPCRILDTRLAGGAFAAGETRTYAMSGGGLPCVSAFPPYLGAVSLNITVTQTAGTGFVTGYPANANLPVVANVTWIGANQTLTNAAVVPTDGGISARISIYASQATHIILDTNGYYGASATGSGNTFLGDFAGNSTMTGDGNTGIGAGALNSNTGGANNTAVGNGALFINATGTTNTAVGYSALTNLSSGIGNIAIGAGACINNHQGNDNVCIHSDGVNGESNTIRIGRPFHSATYVFGIGGTGVSGIPVLVSSSGQLGVASSSRTVKGDIRDIAAESDDLMRLRPVAFRYKPEIDPAGVTQYGLIAEEVAEVYPDLVVPDRNGKPQTVRYHLLVPMLLNETQKQHRTIEAQEKKIERQNAIIERLESRLNELEARRSR